MKNGIDKSTLRDYYYLINPVNGTGGEFMIRYPVLAGEIARRGIKKKVIAERIGICHKSLTNKLTGKAPFTWPEVQLIRHQFFPDMAPEVLFAESDLDAG